MKKPQKSAFTLAEVLIALTILGVIASLTIPTVIQKQREAANRTKIKKSMKVFDFLMSKLVTENNFHSAAEIREYIGENCQKAPSLFKIAHTENNNNCTFVTSDGVYWDVTDIMNPLVSVGKGDERDAVDNKKTFQFSASFDENGSLRVNDVLYEKSFNLANASNLENLYKYLKNEKVEESTFSSENYKFSLDKFKNGDFYQDCEEIPLGDGYGYFLEISCTIESVNLEGFLDINVPITQVYDEEGRGIGIYNPYMSFHDLPPTTLSPGVRTIVPVYGQEEGIIYAKYYKYDCDENMQNCTKCEPGSDYPEDACPEPNKDGYYE